MITVQKHSEDALRLLDSKGKGVGWIYGPHHFPEGEEFPVKSLTVYGDTIRVEVEVEVERPLSLVEAVGAYHGFSLNYSTNGDGKQKRKLYAAWLREIEKEKT